jgi:hypothetical protein
MSSGGRFLTRGLKAVKAEAALSILVFNIFHAFGVVAISRAKPQSRFAAAEGGAGRRSSGKA